MYKILFWTKDDQFGVYPLDNIPIVFETEESAWNTIEEIQKQTDIFKLMWVRRTAA